MLEELDRAVRSLPARKVLESMAASVESELAASEGDLLAWKSVPLGTYVSGIPPQIKSSWVFVLRAGSTTGAEKHSNSLQRMTSFRGEGDFQVKPEERWISHPMTSDAAAPLEDRWISIQEGVWHQGVVGPVDWVVVSFHTVAEEDLAEERPGAQGSEPSSRYYSRGCRTSDGVCGPGGARADEEE